MQGVIAEWGSRSLVTARRAMVALLTVLLVATGLVLVATDAGADPPDLPTTELVPVTGGSTPFLATTFDLAKYKYVEEEYLLTGAANVYEYDNDNNSDVIPQVIQIREEDVPYTSRILVRRPTKPKKFNGTVVLEILNPTAGFDGDTIWLNTHRHLMREGAIWVGVTIKPVAVDFLEFWNPARYPTVEMSDLGQAYDMYSQLGALLKTESSPENPLAGFSVERIIGTGYSQSASYLVTYANEFGDDATLADGRPAFDGYFIAATGAGAKQVNSEEENTGISHTDERRFLTTDTPIVRFQTETEVAFFGSWRARQPDSDTYRLYEMAGGAHVDQRSNELLFGTAWARDLGFSPVTCANDINPIPIGHLEASSIHNLDRWLRDGTAPPPGAVLEIDSGVIVRDADGNALGGVRLPNIDVPIGQYLPSNTGSGFCFLFGSFIPFDDAKIGELYRNHGAYVRQIRERAKSAEAAGYLLKEDAREIMTEAAGSSIGK